LILLLLVLSATLYGIRVSISLRKQPALVPSLSPKEEILTKEDMKALKEIVAANPLPKDNKTLTEDDTKFLVESNVLDEKEAKILFEIEKLLKKEE